MQDVSITDYSQNLTVSCSKILVLQHSPKLLKEIQDSLALKSKY